MNQILLFPEDLISDTQALLSGRRLLHLREILGKSAGDTVKAGVYNGLRGHAKIMSVDSGKAILDLTLDTPPPPRLPMTLVIAMQRPKTTRKILHCAASLGIGKIYIIRSWRVEKGYFSNPILTAHGLRDALASGMEQSLDTIPPHVEIRKRFRPFVEDEIPSIIAGTTALVAHPYAQTACPCALRTSVTLALGPEGGFIPFEIELFAANGFLPVTVGERILRTENALPYLAGKLSSV
ncbi:MAG TPA: 16S rRNA (uracil(1498)-N(3))-methyltransferase [Spirochaetota bacterium]